MTLSPLLLTLLLVLVAGVSLVVALLISARRVHALDKQLAALQARAAEEAERVAERETLLARAEERLAGVFGDLAGQSLSRNSEAFLLLARENLAVHQEQARAELADREKAVAELVAPIRAALEKAEQQLSAIEKERLGAYGAIRSQLAAMTSDQQALQAETRNLVNALRRPQVRGQWGELTLRRVAELAGMVEHCDFFEQETTSCPEGLMRPDMIVRLPERGELVVDVKTPLEAYLEAIEAPSEEQRRLALQRHARHVADRVRELSGKAYWAQFQNSPEFVILFIPGEQFLEAALAENPGLLEEAMRSKVILTTPTSLVALLRAVAYGWRQRSLEEHAAEIQRVGQELYERLTPFSSHLVRLGRQLDGAVRAFNDAVGSFERMVLPGAKRLAELGIRGRQEIAAPEPLESAPRVLAAAAVERPTSEAPPDEEAEDTRPH
jgi:DNA recombination protein RmuC